uniref:Protein kinase domain-containing protein n=1 Tax=Panagrolaimus sp. ES5 TaxID=591445 RepID=A0AC34GG87_9BILA
LENVTLRFGKPDEIRLIDYGLTSKVENGYCTMPHLGTALFASRESMEKAPKKHFKDDCESWLSTLVYGTNDSVLEPWTNTKKRDVMLQQKKSVWQKDMNRAKFLGGLPIHFWRIMDIIDEIVTEKPVDYTSIYNLLQEVIDQDSCQLVQADRIPDIY